MWTREQPIEFLNSIAGHKRYLCYHFVADTGLRRGEAAALREVDVDPQHNELFVITRTDPEGREDDDGKLKSPCGTRTIALDHIAAGPRSSPWRSRAVAGRRQRPQSVLEMLGHTSMSFTADYYV